ncbi:MAG: hypothetical protein RLZZ357_2000 [Bacteroidota bacterium]
MQRGKVFKCNIFNITVTIFNNFRKSVIVTNSDVRSAIICSVIRVFSYFIFINILAVNRRNKWQSD